MSNRTDDKPKPKPKPKPQAPRRLAKGVTSLVAYLDAKEKEKDDGKGNPK